MAFSLFRAGFRTVNKLIEKKVICSENVVRNTIKNIETKIPLTPRNCLLNYTVVLTTVPQTPTVFSAREYSKKSKHIPKNREYEDDSDSDDEFEQYYKKKGAHNERGNTDFWRRKMRTLHGILDVNNDGVISFDDYMLLAKKFADIGNLPPGTYEDFMNVMRKTWEEQWGEINPYNLVTAEQFLADMHHALNDKQLVKKIHRFLPYFFRAVDTDNSGYLDLSQYKLFFKCLGLTDEDAAISFAVIDQNGDGKLSLKEFVKLGKDYFLTEDERRVSRMFWGPLVNH